MQTKLRAIGGQELVLGLSSKPLTAWGGLAVFASFCESLGLRQVVEQALASFQRTSPNALPVADHLIGFLAGVLTGTQLEVMGSFAGLMANYTASHIHRAPAGSTGPVVVGLAPQLSSSTSGDYRGS